MNDKPSSSEHGMPSRAPIFSSIIPNPNQTLTSSHPTSPAHSSKPQYGQSSQILKLMKRREYRKSRRGKKWRTGDDSTFLCSVGLLEFLPLSLMGEVEDNWDE